MNHLLNDNIAAEKHPSELFTEKLHQLDQRQWWLWSSVALVLILLTVAVGSFAFPAVLSQEQSNYSFFLNQAVRALVGMVLLFTVYLVYQQVLIVRVRRQVAEQVLSLARVEKFADEAYKLAALDELTGLYNRRLGEQRLHEEISRAARHERPLALLFLDLDGLKQINDEFGHAAGDLALKSFAEYLQKATRASDTVVRLGGDEFMVLLPECPEDEVERVLGRVGLDHVNYDGNRIKCRFSRGWTTYKTGETAQEFMKRADDALYADKQTRKKSNSVLAIQHVGESR